MGTYQADWVCRFRMSRASRCKISLTSIEKNNNSPIPFFSGNKINHRHVFDREFVYFRSDVPLHTLSWSIKIKAIIHPRYPPYHKNQLHTIQKETHEDISSIYSDVTKYGYRRNKIRPTYLTKPSMIKLGEYITNRVLAAETTRAINRRRHICVCACSGKYTSFNNQSRSRTHLH